MDDLKDIVCREVAAYAGPMLNGVSYFVFNETQDVFAVVDVATFKGEHIASSGLIVRLIDGFIVIEQDMNDKILLDALLQAGVPREKIVLAYAGEKLPEAEPIAG
jgi:XisI protein